MKKSFFITAILCVMVSVASAEISMDWVTVGNAGNANDDTGFGVFGGVGYEYQIGKYEVTAGQYTEFLNAVAATDPYGLYNTKMADISSDVKGCNIQRGMTGSLISGETYYTYSVAGEWANSGAADWADRPVNYVSWYDTLRFSNWLHNGQPTGSQDASTTEDGAYDMSLGSSVVRKAGAQAFLPSEDEWYKAAYHKNDGVTGSYFDYPTSSDSVPSNDLVEPTDPGNNATFEDYGDYTNTIGSPYYRTEVGAHENSDSPYGTFDMGGNVCEWNEALVSNADQRGVRGSSYSTGEDSFLRSDSWMFLGPEYEASWIGFRVASVPESTNTPPVADAGDDQTVYAEPDGTATVKLDGSGSYDADGDALEYFWFEDVNEIAIGVDPNVVFAAGVHVIDLIVDDGEFSSEPNSVVVTVVEAVEAVAHVFPRVLNTTSRGRYVITRMQLPDGVLADDVESDSFTLIIGDVTIESVRQRGISSRGQDYVFAFFDRSEVIAQAEGKPKLDIIIAGKLTSGQCIYGEDTIKTVKSNGPKKPAPSRKPVRNSRGRQRQSR